jgi:hypothetical protein
MRVEGAFVCVKERKNMPSLHFNMGVRDCRSWTW